MATKKCTKCGEVKPVSEFSKCKNSKDGLTIYCKQCMSAYEQNPKNKAHRKAYRKNQKNKAHKKAYDKEYNDKPENKAKNKAQQQTLEAKAYRKVYNQKPEVKVKSKLRNQKPEVIAKRKIMTQTPEFKLRLCQKRKNDPNYRLRTNIRCRINNAITKGYKKTTSIELLDCSIEYLKQHLKNQFTDNMSWDNHGKYGWHIDHIKPCASFDLTDPEQQKQCFHYTNLQPLWAFENLSKGAKYEIQMD